MTTSHQDSDLQIHFQRAERPPTGNRSGSRASALNVAVIACPCPQCGSLLAVRLWLMTADCWKCGQSIDLSLEEDVQARRVMEAVRAQQAVFAAPPPAAEPQPAPRPPARQPSPAAPPPLPAPRVKVAPAAAPVEESRGDALDELTAWIVSAVLHAVLIILLGLWTFDDDEEKPLIVLSASISEARRTGGEEAKFTFNEHEFDLPVGKKPKNKQQREALIKADQDARELRLDGHAQHRNLPDLSRVRADLKSSDPARRMHAARDPRVRAEIVRREGGTTLTEAAVARALRWMANHQEADGSWSLREFHRVPACGGQCRDGGNHESRTAATALVLMALLGTGQTNQVGLYRDEVAAGLSWLIKNQQPDGDLRAGSQGNSGMYAHGIATLVLCDAFKVTGDETLRPPAQRAVDFILSAQNSAGGWRYQPGAPGDTSVAGWQLMALHSAKAAYLRVPTESLLLAADFLDQVQGDPHGATYAYMPRKNATPTMTSVGLLSRMYLGWNRSDPGLEKGIAYLRGGHLPSAQKPNIYYWYYGTQVMHHWGGAAWDQWNRQMREALVTTQATRGHEAGSWNPQGHPFGAHGGRLYVTALSACTLEVYYRYAPLYWQIDLQ